MVHELLVKNPKNLSKVLWSLKLDEELCDASIVIDDERCPVHAVVLASASKYFREIFVKSPIKEVTFKNVNKEAIRLLIKYCYTGKIRITENNAHDVLSIAHVLSLSHVVESGIKNFANKFSIVDCFSTWKIDQIGYLEKLNVEMNCIKDSSRTLVAVGSNDYSQAKTMEIFDIAKKEWVEAKINCSRIYFSALFYNDKLMLIGGSVKDSAVNTIDCYDPSSGKIEPFSPMKYARSWSSAVQYRGSLYVMGGNHKEILSDNEKWDPASETWVDSTPMLNARFGFEAKLLNNEIFVIGGYGKSGYLNSVEAFNPTKNIWRKCTPMVEKREHPGVAVIGKHLYVVGGEQNWFTHLKSAEKYDPIIDKWTSIQSLDIGRSRLAAGNLDGKLAIFGGFSDDKALSFVESYDDKENEWTQLASLKKSRNSFLVVDVPWSWAMQFLTKKTRK